MTIPTFDTSWKTAITEIANILEEYLDDIHSLHEFAVRLGVASAHQPSEKAMDMLGDILAEKIRNRCLDEELCPECLGKLTLVTERQPRGHYGSIAASELVLLKITCEHCGFEESY